MVISTIRVMSWNILNRGAGEHDRTVLHDEVMREVDPGPLPAHFRVRYNDGTGDFDRSAIATVLGAGFTDVGAVLGDRTPTVRAAGFPDAEFDPFCSDVLLTSPVLAGCAQPYRVIVDERTEAASDHCPFVAEFAMPRGEAR